MKTNLFELVYKHEVQFQGTEFDCRWKLLRIQPNSIQWAITNDGWEIRPCDNSEEKDLKSHNKK